MKITRKANNILDGWYNLFFKNKDVEEFAKVRGEICAKCSKLRTKPTIFCSICYCIIPAKVRAKNESCPLNKW